jgi:ketosteroid isomerase-like protein
MTSTRSELRALVDTRAAAVHVRDLDRLMSVYGPDIVYFDVVPPLRYTGTTALRGRFAEWFDGFEGSIDFATRDLDIHESGDLAFVHMLHRAKGRLKTGRDVGSWVRSTVCCRRSNGRWSITHEHVSIPVDLKTGTARLDLAP